MRRIQKFQEFLKEKKIDYALFMNTEETNPNVFYFSGYEGYGLLVVPRKGRAYLQVPEMERARAKKSGFLKVVSGNEWNKGLRGRRVGLDFGNTTLAMKRALSKKIKARYVDVSMYLLKERMEKEKNELDRIRKACRITDEIFKSCISRFGKFKSEEEVVAYLVNETRMWGCKLAFEPIVASGSNGAEPHHDSLGRIKKGFCVIDFGVKYKGYCSDVTRTIYLGRASNKEREIYENVLNVQKESISNVMEGARASDLHGNVVNVLGKRFTHSLGHGVGIEVHELPGFSEKSKGILREKMVLAIEPGYYYPGKFGIRIEDNVLVGKSKCEILSKNNKELIEVRR